MTDKFIDDRLKRYKDEILKHHDEPRNLNELAQVVIDTINRNTVSDASDCRVVGFSWNIQHGLVRTSHNHPIRHEKRDTDPYSRSEYGWSGRVWIRYSDELRHWGSDGFASSLTYPGTGGGGSYDGPWTDISTAHYKKYARNIRNRKDHDEYVSAKQYPKICCYSWDYRFYDSDWPELAEMAEWNKKRSWAILASKSHGPEPRHHFIWEDEETKAADNLFLAEYQSELESPWI